MKHFIFVPCILFSLAALSVDAQEQTSENNEQLRRGLKQYPEADTNKDGILTMEEGRAHLKKLRVGGAKPAATVGTASSLEPTLKDVSYGPHERNVLDFWQARSDTPAPLVIFIHGGGFVSGDKSKVRGDKTLSQCLDAGVSFAAINYRYRTTAPIQDVLRDCARAVQFLRSKSAEWHLDEERFASYGGSAGAGTSLWLAFHDDMADPGNADPVLRESSRLVCAGAQSCQFSYDILQWPELLGKDVAERYKGDDPPCAFYGLKSDDELASENGRKIRAECDMRGWISRDDPPVFLSTKMSGGEITSRGAYLHHPMHAQAIKLRCDELGVTAIADLPGLQIEPASGQPATMGDFLLRCLLKTVPGS